MAEASTTVRHIAWRELFPWLILFRTFRIAISPSLLAVATVAVLLMPLGWYLASAIFLSPEERDALRLTGGPVPQAANSELAALMPNAPQPYLPAMTNAVTDTYFDLAEPLKLFFRFDLTLRESAYYAFGVLWTLALWAFPGGLITRRAVVQLATDEPPGIVPAAVYAGRRFHHYFLAPLFPLGIVFVVALLIAALGLVQFLLDKLLPGLGTAVTGLSWLLVVLISIGVMWLFGGLIFGWPLMWPTVSAEREGDYFEAFSRSYSYVYGKPLHYFFYVVVAAAFGALCWAVVAVAAVIVQEFGFWALAWGAGAWPVAELRAAALDFAAGEFEWSKSRILWSLGVALLGLLVTLIHGVANAFRYTFFFTVASAIYLLLRQDVDEKEMDEIYVEQRTPTAATQPATPRSAEA
jgi:hypothetical protein